MYSDSYQLLTVQTSWCCPTWHNIIWLVQASAWLACLSPNAAELSIHTALSPKLCTPADLVLLGLPEDGVGRPRQVGGAYQGPHLAGHMLDAFPAEVLVVLQRIPQDDVAVELSCTGSACGDWHSRLQGKTALLDELHARTGPCSRHASARRLFRQPLRTCRT